MGSGIFHVEFHASTGDHGDGLVVIKDGRVNGGDAHYLYQGSVPTESGPFEAEFMVSQWRKGNTNVVGIDNYSLMAKGSVNYEVGSIELYGAVAGNPHLTIRIKGKKIQEAL